MNLAKEKIPVSSDKLLEIARDYGTPTYVYDEKTISSRCQSLRNCFKGLPVTWLYAMKANDNPFVLDIITKNGFGLDTVSFEEVLLGLSFVHDPKEIFYTENNMSDEEMNAAIEAGVTLNIGSFSRLKSFCNHPSATECCIRINPAIGDGHHNKVVTGNKDSKFGISLDAISEVIALSEKTGVRISGLHVHIGSGIQNAENFYNAMEVLLKEARKFPDLSFVNFGGGIPIPYKKFEHEFSLDEFDRLTRPLLEDFQKETKNRISYFFEPGRWLVGRSGMLLSEVTSIKDQAGRLFLGTNTGFNHLLRPALYDAYHEVINLNKIDNEDTTTYDIAGNICESGDILGVNRLMPDTEIGDILAFADAGAYGMTMASYYNRRALPAEVLVQEDGSVKEIRPRANPRDTIQRYMMLTGFSK